MNGALWVWVVVVVGGWLVGCHAALPQLTHARKMEFYKDYETRAAEKLVLFNTKRQTPPKLEELKPPLHGTPYSYGFDFSGPGEAGTMHITLMFYYTLKKEYGGVGLDSVPLLYTRKIVKMAAKYIEHVLTEQVRRSQIPLVVFKRLKTVDVHIAPVKLSSVSYVYPRSTGDVDGDLHAQILLTHLSFHHNPGVCGHLKISRANLVADQYQRMMGKEVPARIAAFFLHEFAHAVHQVADFSNYWVLQEIAQQSDEVKDPAASFQEFLTAKHITTSVTQILSDVAKDVSFYAASKSNSAGVLELIAEVLSGNWLGMCMEASTIMLVASLTDNIIPLSQQSHCTRSKWPCPSLMEVTPPAAAPPTTTPPRSAPRAGALAPTPADF